MAWVGRILVCVALVGLIAFFLGWGKGDSPGSLAGIWRGGGAVAAAAQDSVAAPTLASVRVGAAPGRAIPATFLGLAHEWTGAQAMMGDSQIGVNPIYRQLLSNLTAFGSGPLLLRIGGSSTDYQASQNREPTPTAARPFAELAQALGVCFSLGVNLKAGDVNLAATQARDYLGQMPPGSVFAIEIGNEPDNYNLRGHDARPPGYAFPDYLAEFDAWKQHILPLLPAGTKLMGPSGGQDRDGMFTTANLETFVAREANSLALVSEHFYVTHPQPNLRDDVLLMPNSATKGPMAVAAAVGVAHAHGVPIRMAEMNSASHGGVPGVSDAFGSALWIVDNLFEYLSVGIDGVNVISTSNNAYSSFYFNIDKSHGRASYSLDSVHPIYYGLLFFQAATGNGARMLPAEVDTRANLKAWATVDSRGTPRLVVINKDESQAGAVAVTLPGYSRALVLRLAAPAYNATSGVTFAGQTFDGSADGRLRGKKTVETLEAVNGVFPLSMPVTSAALVVFTK